MVMKRIVRMRELPRSMDVVLGSYDLYEVLTHNKDSYVVNLTSKSCDCGDQQVLGLPCNKMY